MHMHLCWCFNALIFSTLRIMRYRGEKIGFYYIDNVLKICDIQICNDRF